MTLSELHTKLTVQERKALAEKTGIGAPYLWQLANKYGDRKPSRDVMLALVAADRRLTLKDLAAEFPRAEA